MHVFGFGFDHMAKHHMVHILVVQAGTGRCFFHHERGQFVGGASFRQPLKVPMAVRVAATTATSLMALEAIMDRFPASS